MTSYEWTPALSTGDEEIDRQHQMLLNMMNRLHNHLKEAPDMRLMIELFLDDLVSYMEIHFQAEEKLMGATNYPEQVGHRAMHDHIRAQMKVFREKFKKNEVDVSEELMDFLQHWIVEHIHKADTLLASHLGKRH